MKLYKLLRITICTLTIIYSLSGCFASHKATAVASPSAYAKTITKAKNNKRLMILQSGINTYVITSVETDKAKQHFTVQLNQVDSTKLGLFKKVDNKDLSAVEPPARPVSAIRVIMKDSTSYTLDEPHTLPLQNIARIEQN